MAEPALVLVVDDTASVRAQVSALVENLGHRAVAVGGCEEAIAAIKQEVPSLVLMDLQMVPTRGDACCKQIRAHPEWESFPIAMLTSAESPNDLMYCWRAAADDFLPKPANGEQLEAKLSAVLAARSVPTGTLKPLTLLVAVSSPFLKAETHLLLEHVGLGAVFARSKQQVEQLLAGPTDHFAGVLVELSMPDGPAVLEVCHAAVAKRSLPVCAVSTASLEPAAAKRAEELTGRPVVMRDSATPELVAHEIVDRLVPPSLAELSPVDRVPFFAIVEFRSGKGPFFTGYSFSLASGSIFVRTLNVLPPGAKLEMSVHFADARDTMKCEGVVAWSNSFAERHRQPVPVGMGVKLTLTDPVLARFAPRHKP